MKVKVSIPDGLPLLLPGSLAPHALLIPSSSFSSPLHLSLHLYFPIQLGYDPDAAPVFHTKGFLG